MAEPKRLLPGWGRTAPTAAHIRRPRGERDLAELVARRDTRGVIARGLGRSYGDAAQNAGGTVLDMTATAEDCAFPDSSGEIVCAAGVSIAALLRRSVPAGWFMPVSPGTRYVTLGGALAADVHGKNHHRDGSIGRHVARLELVDGSGVRHV